MGLRFDFRCWVLLIKVEDGSVVVDRSVFGIDDRWMNRPMQYEWSIRYLNCCRDEFQESELL